MDDMNKKLLDNIKNSISEAIPEKKIGIAFSGGVDSTLISKICSDMNYDIILLTIGFPDSHDILFAKEVNDFLKYPHHTLEIDSDTFSTVSSKINQTIKTDNLSWNEKCLKFYANKRAVKTASDTQVRRPIYNGSLESWRHYEKNLNSFYL